VALEMSTGKDLTAEERGLETPGEILGAELAGLEVAFHQRLVVFGDVLDEVVAHRLRTLCQLRVDLPELDLARTLRKPPPVS